MNAARLAEPVILFQGYHRVVERAFGRGSRIHDVCQHRARLDRSQLIAVTEENHAAALRQGIEELRKKRKRRHRRFVNHQQIKRERILPIMPEVDRVTFNSQESMNSRSANRHARLYFFRTIKLLQPHPEGFFQPRCCFAGRCSQRYAKAFVPGFWSRRARICKTVVVLPVPGPPQIMVSSFSTAASIAPAWVPPWPRCVLRVLAALSRSATARPCW